MWAILASTRLIAFIHWQTRHVVRAYYKSWWQNLHIPFNKDRARVFHGQESNTHNRTSWPDSYMHYAGMLYHAWTSLHSLNKKWKSKHSDYLDLQGLASLLHKKSCDERVVCPCVVHTVFSCGPFIFMHEKETIREQPHSWYLQVAGDTLTTWVCQLSAMQRYLPGLSLLATS